MRANDEKDFSISKKARLSLERTTSHRSLSLFASLRTKEGTNLVLCHEETNEDNIMSSNAFVKTQKVPEGSKCLCGDAECLELTAAFTGLRDPRKRFVRLPPYEANASSPFIKNATVYVKRICVIFSRTIILNKPLQQTLLHFITFIQKLSKSTLEKFQNLFPWGKLSN